MMTLLLGTILALVWASQAHHHDTDITAEKISGRWITLYMAANDTSLVQTNGPLRCYMSSIDPAWNENIRFNFYVKNSEECLPVSIVAKKSPESGHYIVDYEGHNTLDIKKLSNDYLMLHTQNENDGVVSHATALLGRRSRLSDKSILSEYSAFNTPWDIVKENIIEVQSEDTCTSKST
ncbi:major urinary protein-like [Tachyglossus aculeatus]|uniref:major urinary protein-like n=1 Tax=Tachyglossus aculeatus TaxID=9261 RepID=UPI0018F28ED3|nr:major urinary protein-like [Tachyglossus aculeatus]